MLDAVATQYTMSSHYLALVNMSCDVAIQPTYPFVSCSLSITGVE